MIEQLLNSPEALAQIVAAIVGGVFTILAGIFSVYLYTTKQKQEHAKNFLQWLTDFTVQFQDNENFGRLRVQLAEERQKILAILAAEMVEDGVFDKVDLAPELARDIENADAILQDMGKWQFLRSFTDYLYFFEQVLAYGEELYDSGVKRKSAQLVDHFGWFLRSLLTTWPKYESSQPDTEPYSFDGNHLFIEYLAISRYHRLCEAAIYLNPSEVENKIELYKRVKATLLDQSGARRTKKSYSEVQRKWRRILENEGRVYH